MADHIPFVYSKTGAKLAQKFYSDSAYVRVPLHSYHTLKTLLSESQHIWIDPEIDGIHNHELAPPSSTNNPTNEYTNKWLEYTSQVQNFNAVRQNLKKPTSSAVEIFIFDILDRCNAFSPECISVPQLPVTNNSDRNKINKCMAIATGLWKSSRSYTGKLIFPLILTNQSQSNLKSSRNPKIHEAVKNYTDSAATGLWVVDSSLDDDTGSKTLQDTRFPSIIHLHEELNAKINSTLRIAGPYWGLNLVLWARGLTDYPAVGVGSTYKYFIPGVNFPHSAAAKIPISPLRCHVPVTPQLWQWIEEAINNLGKSSPHSHKLDALLKNKVVLNDPERARSEVARFYKFWFDIIQKHPKEGRSIALFHDFSEAYTIGKILPNLPNGSVTRKASSIVEPFMLHCL